MGIFDIVNKISDASDTVELKGNITSSYYYMNNVKTIYNNYLRPYPEYNGLTNKDLLDRKVGHIEYKIPKNATFSCKIKLIKEPNNPHDKLAIKIMADKLQIGYVPAYMLPEVHKHFKAIDYIDILPCGGPYKQVVVDELSRQKVVTINTDFSFFIYIRYRTGAIKNIMKDAVNKGIEVAKDKEIADKTKSGLMSLKSKILK